MPAVRFAGRRDGCARNSLLRFGTHVKKRPEESTSPGYNSACTKHAVEGKSTSP